MFDFFRNNNDNERRDDNPRFIFVQQPRNSRPLLTKQGYRFFSGSFFSVWLLFIFILWVFRIEISPSKELISAISGSSVELSALSLAVLGIIHELNKADKWFKIGLLLVALLFIGVVLSGFLLVLTWKSEYDQPQQIKVYVFAALGILTLTQIDWTAVIRISRINILKKITIPTSLKLSIERVRFAIPFLLPVLIFWTPDLNRLTGVILLFSGGVVALAALMVVTTVSLLVTKPVEETEDEFVAVLKARYETEIKTIIRFGELKSLMLAALRFLQDEHIRNLATNPPVPKGVERKHIFDRLREMGNSENERSFETVLSSLVDAGKVCQESYSGPYWLTPDDALMTTCLGVLDQLAVTCAVDYPNSYGRSKNELSNYLFGTYSFDDLQNWLVNQTRLPLFVVSEYIMPKILRELAEPQHFAQIHRTVRESSYSSEKTKWIIFVNRTWQIQDALFEFWNELKLSELSDRQKVENFIAELPSTDNVPRAVTPLEVSKILSSFIEQKER